MEAYKLPSKQLCICWSNKKTLHCFSYSRGI